MKKLKLTILSLMMFQTFFLTAQEFVCDDFEDMTEWPTTSFGADYLIGYSQGGTQAINSGATTFGDVNGSWPGIYGVGPVDFNFDGTNQSVRFLMYGLLPQFNEMGFNVNGSPLVYLDATFPMTVSGVTVNLDLSPPNLDEWEYYYLTFTGDIDVITQELFESAVTELCVEHLDAEEGCDNFLDTDIWYLPEEFGEGDLLGYTQEGAYEVSCAEGHGYLNTFGEVGISIGTGIVDFDFSGGNQTARFTVYHTGLDEDMGFAVNGSVFTYLDASFPVVIDGVTVDLDTSPADPDMDDDIWGYLSYLTFTGEIDEISIYALEGGITELCVEQLDEEDGCDNFFDTDIWLTDMDGFTEGDVLGYTQDGSYAVTCTDGHGTINSWGETGIFIGDGIVDFEFSGGNQTARFTVNHSGLDEDMSFAVNGSVFTYLDASFPVVIDGVTVDLDTSPADPDMDDDLIGFNSYLIFTGEIDEVSIYALEGAIIELCVEQLDSVDDAGIHNQTATNFSLYPNPATNNLTIIANTPLNQIQFYALSGELILTELGQGSTQKQINISHLNSGVYMVKIALEDGTEYIQKLIKE